MRNPVNLSPTTYRRVKLRLPDLQTDVANVSLTGDQPNELAFTRMVLDRILHFPLSRIDFAHDAPKISQARGSSITQAGRRNNVALLL